MRKKRRFILDECNHVYQRTVNGINIFYDTEDYLLCLTILTTSARKYNIKLIEVCFMIDHIHILLVSETCRQMAEFIRYYSSIFAHEYNTSVSRKGQLFFKSFGSAPKKGDKKTRSAIIYIGNNPVEKKLCCIAEDYRWNFLAYIKDPKAFSPQLPSKNYSPKLRKSIKEVKVLNSLNRYINPHKLHRLFEGLDNAETEILTDVIVSEYMPLDTNGLLKYYTDYDQMIYAMKSSSGSDYDVKETYWPGSDQIYRDMAKYLKEVKGMKQVRSVIQLPEEEKMLMAEELKHRFGATEVQVGKFLHMRANTKH